MELLLQLFIVRRPGCRHNLDIKSFADFVNFSSCFVKSCLVEAHDLDCDLGVLIDIRTNFPLDDPKVDIELFARIQYLIEPFSVE